MKQKYEIIVLDLYGTLLKKNNLGLFNDLYKAMRLGPEESRGATRVRLTRHFESISEFVRYFHPNVEVNCKIFEPRIKKIVKNVELFPDTLNALKTLSELGYNIGLVSNLITQFKEPFFRFKLNKFIQNPIFSCDYGFMKPENEIYELIGQSHNISKENILFVGDNFICDYQAPINNNINAVLLDRDNVFKNKNKEIKIINSLDELIKYL